MSTIKDLAKALNIQSSTIRYYEKNGLIDFKRDENGYRTYDKKDLQRLKLILIMKYSNYSIQEISDVMKMNSVDTEDCKDLATQVILNKREEIKRKIATYTKILELADYLLGQTEKLIDEESDEFDEFIDDVFEKIKEH